MYTQRGRFARIAVEIDLAKPLTVSFSIDGEDQRVEYESLPCVCFSCGRVGHNAELCPERKRNSEVNSPNLGKEADRGNEMRDNSSAEGQEEGRFGPWIHVQRRSRRVNAVKKGEKDSRTGEKGVQQRESRFRFLSENKEESGEEQENFQEAAIVNEANENKTRHEVAVETSNEREKEGRKIKGKFKESQSMRGESSKKMEEAKGMDNKSEDKQRKDIGIEGSGYLQVIRTPKFVYTQTQEDGQNKEDQEADMLAS